LGDTPNPPDRGSPLSTPDNRGLAPAPPNNGKGRELGDAPNPPDRGSPLSTPDYWRNPGRRGGEPDVAKLDFNRLKSAMLIARSPVKSARLSYEGFPEA